MPASISTDHHEVPAWFLIQCVRCFLSGHTVQAAAVIKASSGYGLAACAEHRAVTDAVMRQLSADDDAQLRKLFGVPDPEGDSRGPGEGVVYGRLPGSGDRGRSHSVADVMFGRPRR